MIKIAFFDVDGTLLRLGHKELSANTAAALRQLHQNGIILCMATGRCYTGVPHFDGIDFDVLLTFNGSFVTKGNDIIFKNPQALSQVNRIVHPRVIRDFQHWREQQNSPLVFFESAILFEAGLTRHFDFIICVTASEATRLKRVILRDATNEDKVKERMQNQAADTEKCKNSDFIIYNDEDHMVVQQVLDVLNKLNLKIQ